MDNFVKTRKKEWDLYYATLKEENANKTINDAKSKNNMLTNMKFECSLSLAANNKYEFNSYDFISKFQEPSDMEHVINTFGYKAKTPGHPFASCDHLKISDLLGENNVLGLPYLFNQLLPDSRLWITYRTIEYLFNQANQQNSLGRFNLYFWAYADFIKSIDVDLKELTSKEKTPANITPETYLIILKQIFNYDEGITAHFKKYKSGLLKQIKSMYRFNNTILSDNEIYEIIQNMSQDIFVQTFKTNKSILKMIDLPAMNDEIAMTSFLEILNTGPVFNSLLLSKYIPNDLNSDNKVIYSWKNLGKGTQNWLEFAEGMKDEYEMSLYTIGATSIASIIGMCALNAYGFVAIAALAASSGVLGLSLVKEAQSQKLLKFVLLTIGWHAPTITYITYQVLVLKAIVTRLLAIQKTSDEKMASYKSQNIHDEFVLADLEIYVNHKKQELDILTQTITYKSCSAIVSNSKPPPYENKNIETLHDMAKKLEYSSSTFICPFDEVIINIITIMYM